MNKMIDYFYTHSSPWTYLGSVRFHEIAKAAGASINYRPCNLGRIFPQSGGLPLPKRAPQRQRYRMFELKRWRDHLGVQITLEPAFFPADGSTADRMVIAADKQGLDTGRLSNSILRGIWVEEKNIADDDTLVSIANAQGMDGNALLDIAQSHKIGTAYDTYTQEGIDRHVFGAPTYIYNDEPFWGQDRLDFVEKALQSG